MDNWGQGTCTLCVSRLYRRAIDIADVEAVGVPWLAPSVPFPCGETQGLGCPIRVQSLEVYMGQPGAHAASLRGPGQGLPAGLPVPHTGTEELPEEVADVPLCSPLLHRFASPPGRYCVTGARSVAFHDPLVRAAV